MCSSDLRFSVSVHCPKVSSSFSSKSRVAIMLKSMGSTLFFASLSSGSSSSMDSVGVPMFW